MPERCASDPARECQSATRLALLEERVKSIENGQKEESEFRKEYYESQRSQIKRDAELDAKIDSMDEKLDRLVTWQEALQEKPVKRWDSIVDKIIWCVLAAVIAFLLARIGL